MSAWACTACGKALLAELPQDEAERLVPQPIVPLTSHTIVDRGLLLGEIEQFPLGAALRDEHARLAGQRWLVFSIDSDFCFYPEEQAELVKHLEDAKTDVMHIIVHSDKGHDSFLLEPDLYTPHVSWLLGK